MTNPTEKIKEIEKEIENLLLKWNNSNGTVCPLCNVDDFTHIENCKYADNDIITWLKDLFIKEWEAREKEIIEIIKSHIGNTYPVNCKAIIDEIKEREK